MKLPGIMMPTGKANRDPRFGAQFDDSKQIRLPDLPKAPGFEETLRAILDLSHPADRQPIKPEDIFKKRPH